LVKTNMPGIAAIIFIASIVVPVAKILGLAYILLCIQFKRQGSFLTRMKMYRIIQWIGKWSMMDLFVISIMVTLIDRGQLLDFTPGPGAIAFAVVVVLTMLAAESLDSRLIWDNYEQPK
ncbi:paraquat-inducible membrane protein A, partial [Photobacterium damselae subsp. damselae]